MFKETSTNATIFFPLLADRQAEVRLPVLWAQSLQHHHRHRRLPLHRRIRSQLAGRHAVHRAVDGELRYTPVERQFRQVR